MYNLPATLSRLRSLVLGALCHANDVATIAS
jgi:hypothetical protein